MRAELQPGAVGVELAALDGALDRALEQREFALMFTNVTASILDERRAH